MEGQLWGPVYQLLSRLRKNTGQSEGDKIRAILCGKGFGRRWPAAHHQGTEAEGVGVALKLKRHFGLEPLEKAIRRIWREVC